MFFPAAGYRKAYSYISVTNAGYELNYATSKKPDYNTYNLDILATYSSRIRICNGNIQDATSVRCVRIEPPTALEKGETDDETDGDMNSNGTYTVTLVSSETNAKAWQLSSSESSPDPSLYDGVYESTNTGKNSMSKMYIDIEGYTYFRFYIRCHTEGEARYDYVLVSQLDRGITSSTHYSSPEIYTSTYDFSNAGTTIDCYKLVEFFYVDGCKHRITIAYIKDDDGTEGSNKGYVLIPKNQ